MTYGLRKEFREVIESGTLLEHGTDRSRNRQTSLAGAQTMSNAKVRGIVHLIEDTKTFGQKGFRKRMIVLEQQNGRFANYIPLEFTNDACDLADDLRLPVAFSCL